MNAYCQPQPTYPPTYLRTYLPTFLTTFLPTQPGGRLGLAALDLSPPWTFRRFGHATALDLSPPFTRHLALGFNALVISWETTDVLPAATANVLSADTADVLPADSTDVLSAETTGFSSENGRNPRPSDE